MDREILFRGKRLDNGEWVEGYYVPIGGQYHYIFTGKLDITGLYPTFDRHEVDLATVRQYTGLTDKNEKKIFEGDIVKTSKYGKDDGQGHNFNGPDTFQVNFEDGGYCLRNKWRRFNLRPDVDIEVIGNIHDNPELMGGEDDG